MRPIIRITVEGGVVQAVEHFKGSGAEANDPLAVMVWDFDCEGDGGTHKNIKGEEFNLDIYTPEEISLEDLYCEEINRGEKD